jgi:5,10-methylene-tetrahydrofolate dehydrogenase/methenyl tetrahydrofolate cyclohydrolase
MVAQKLDGNAIAKSIREKLCAEVTEKQKLNPRFKPCLKIIQGMTLSLVMLYMFNADSIVLQWVIVQTLVRNNLAPPS